MKQDTFREQRNELANSLERKGIKDKNVLEAIRQVKRELFIPDSFINRAYEDNALPIDCSQTISQPYTVAFMTELLQVKPGSKILEIGTGSGYQSVILSFLGARVFSVERISELYVQVNEFFKKHGVNVNTRLGDGSLGWSEFAPYDGIIVTAAAPEVPISLKEQLAVGGRLVIPTGKRDYQTMCLITRTSKDTYTEAKFDSFKFVPLLGKEGWQDT